MEFRTRISLIPSPFEINLETPVLSVGSCFSTCIGNRLLENKFNVIVNPFGTLFNPISIFKLIAYAATGDTPPENTYVQVEGIWKNLDFHSDFSAPDKALLEEKIANSIATVRKVLPSLSYLLITPGTALVYETTAENYLVANCHKLPPSQFRQKRLLETEEIVSTFDKLKRKLQTINPALSYILTVSPVRHIKDTLELNSWSKSVLLIAMKKLALQNENVAYFPSYEIMMDDLRDYRFYTADMIHPSPVAEEYIWNEFSKSYFRNGTTEFLKQWSKIKEAMAHRPFYPDSPAYQSFLAKTISRLTALNSITDVSKEIAFLEEKINGKQAI